MPQVLFPRANVLMQQLHSAYPDSRLRMLYTAITGELGNEVHSGVTVVNVVIKRIFGLQIVLDSMFEALPIRIIRHWVIALTQHDDEVQEEAVAYLDLLRSRI
jgi:hypothetical protein